MAVRIQGVSAGVARNGATVARFLESSRFSMPAERLLPLRTSPGLASEGNNASVPCSARRRTLKTGDELFSLKTICPPSCSTAESVHRVLRDVRRSLFERRHQRAEV